MTLKKQKSRTDSADQARAKAGAVIDKALEDSAATPGVKAARKEKLTKYPSSVREARDQNESRDSADGQRADETAPAKPDSGRG